MWEFKGMAGEERLIPVPTILPKEMVITTQIPHFFQLNQYTEKLML